MVVARRQFLLLVLLWFNAITAILGGLALMSNTILIPPAQLAHSGFGSGYFPGVILFAVVGGSSLLAALGWHKKLANAGLLSLLAGLIMLFWIVGEMVSIRSFHPLQVVYLITGAAVVWLTPTKG